MARGLGSAAVLAATLLVAGLAVAHGPPSVRDQDARLLADHNDDCGGDSGSLSNCNGSHDLVGLDVREGHDAARGDLVYFRVLMNGGSGSLRDVLTLKANGAVKTFELRTTDNQAFEGTGFATVTTEPLLDSSGKQDGSRFVVEGSVPLADLGGRDAKLTDFQVTAYSGTTKGDFMPGTYTTVAGTAAPTGNNEQNSPTSYVRTTGYVLRGPTYYANAATPTSTTVPAGGQQTVDVTFTNLLKNTPQTLTVTLADVDGASATFEGGAQSLTFDLLKGATSTHRVVVAGDDPGATGAFTLTVSTNLGGRTEHPLAFTVATGASTSPTDSTPPTSTPANGAPGPGLPLALGLFAFAALRRRS